MFLYNCWLQYAVELSEKKFWAKNHFWSSLRTIIWAILVSWLRKVVEALSLARMNRKDHVFIRLSSQIYSKTLRREVMGQKPLFRVLATHSLGYSGILAEEAHRTQEASFWTEVNHNGNVFIWLLPQICLKTLRKEVMDQNHDSSYLWPIARDILVFRLMTSGGLR